MKDPELFHRAAFSSSYSGRIYIFVELFVLGLIIFYFGLTFILTIFPVPLEWTVGEIALGLSIPLAIGMSLFSVLGDSPQSKVFWKFLPVSKKMMYAHYEKKIKIRESQTQFLRNRMNTDIQTTNEIEKEIIDLKREQFPYLEIP